MYLTFSHFTCACLNHAQREPLRARSSIYLASAGHHLWIQLDKSLVNRQRFQVRPVWCGNEIPRIWLKIHSVPNRPMDIGSGRFRLRLISADPCWSQVLTGPGLSIFPLHRTRVLTRSRSSTRLSWKSLYYSFLLVRARVSKKPWYLANFRNVDRATTSNSVS